MPHLRLLWLFWRIWSRIAFSACMRVSMEVPIKVLCFKGMPFCVKPTCYWPIKFCRVSWRAFSGVNSSRWPTPLECVGRLWNWRYNVRGLICSSSPSQKNHKPTYPRIHYHFICLSPGLTRIAAVMRLIGVPGLLQKWLHTQLYLTNLVAVTTPNYPKLN